MNEDPFPKAANVNMVVITLLAEKARDYPCPERKLVAEEEMHPVKNEDEERPGVFSCIFDPMGRLCVCYQGDIAMVRQMHEECSSRSGGPSGEVQDSSSRSLP